MKSIDKKEVVIWLMTLVIVLITYSGAYPFTFRQLIRV